MKGVAIGFARGVRFIPEERMVDPEGRYLFLRGRINEVEYSIANIYGPNRYPTKFLLGVVERFMEFRTGWAIMVGDFNICMDSEIDCTSRARQPGTARGESLKKKLHQYQLMDGWRIQRAKIRDYTFHSTVHGTYSRIDLFLEEHRMLNKVIGSNIEIGTFSDIPQFQ